MVFSVLKTFLIFLLHRQLQKPVSKSTTSHPSHEADHLRRNGYWPVTSVLSHFAASSRGVTASKQATSISGTSWDNFLEPATCSLDDLPPSLATIHPDFWSYASVSRPSSTSGSDLCPSIGFTIARHRIQGKTGKLHKSTLPMLHGLFVGVRTPRPATVLSVRLANSARRRAA